ncbi:MAG: helix-turn-helix domain-containing protein [Firmicutes bacterium]|nr:helix-turn-helix domain-containing protein [Bacillota bacterium]
MEELKDIIAHNLVAYRKNAGLTQQEIADKINYSDKAVSKWERGEGVPDVSVLKEISDLYGVTVNDFLIVHTDKPAVTNVKTRKAKHWLVALLSFGLVWFVATIVMAIGLIVDSSLPMPEYSYIIALPVSMIVLVVFSCIWGRLWMQALSVSALVWSACVLVHVLLSPLLGISAYAWTIYIAGAALQLLVILWYLLRFFIKRSKKS